MRFARQQQAAAQDDRIDIFEQIERVAVGVSASVSKRLARRAVGKEAGKRVRHRERGNPCRERCRYGAFRPFEHEPEQPGRDGERDGKEEEKPDGDRTMQSTYLQ